MPACYPAHQWHLLRSRNKNISKKQCVFTNDLLILHRFLLLFIALPWLSTQLPLYLNPTGYSSVQLTTTILKWRVSNKTVLVVFSFYCLPISVLFQYVWNQLNFFFCPCYYVARVNGATKAKATCFTRPILYVLLWQKFNLCWACYLLREFDR